MKKLVLMLLVLVLTACGGSDFVGATAQDDAAADNVAEASDATQNDALEEAKAEASLDAMQPDPDAGVDALAPDAEAGDEPKSDVCVPGTCETLGKNCGPTPDGCGGTITSCGACSPVQLCGGGGVPNVCGGCVPDSCALHGYSCGTITDGCGNTLVCGPDVIFAGPDSLCGDGGPTPYVWTCSGGIGPRPYPDCIGPDYFGYCCPESK